MSTKQPAAKGKGKETAEVAQKDEASEYHCECIGKHESIRECEMNTGEAIHLSILPK